MKKLAVLAALAIASVAAQAGMTLHKPDAAMMAEFQRVGSVVADEWLKKAGADGQQILKTFRGK